MALYSLKEKRVVLTGAASGIGRCLALDLAARGALLLLVDKDEQRLHEVCGECNEVATSRGHRAARAASIAASALPLDLTEPGAAAMLRSRCEELWSGLDVLINNAGVTHYGPTHQMTAEQMQRLMDVNLLGPMQLTRELLPFLLASPRGQLVNISSMYGFLATPRVAAYHASKFGLLGFTESLQGEYRGRLAVMTVCPGFVDTDLFASGTSSAGAVPRPPSWMTTTPQLAARRIIRAIEREERFVIITRTAKFLYYAKRFVPWILPLLAWLAAESNQKSDGSLDQ